MTNRKKSLNSIQTLFKFLFIGGVVVSVVALIYTGIQDMQAIDTTIINTQLEEIKHTDDVETLLNLLNQYIALADKLDLVGLEERNPTDWIHTKKTENLLAYTEAVNLRDTLQTLLNKGMLPTKEAINQSISLMVSREKLSEFYAPIDERIYVNLSLLGTIITAIGAIGVFIISKLKHPCSEPKLQNAQ